MEITATSVPTARMTPSRVRKLRSLWERSASRARRKVSPSATLAVLARSSMASPLSEAQLYYERLPLAGCTEKAGQPGCWCLLRGCVLRKFGAEWRILIAQQPAIPGGFEDQHEARSVERYVPSDSVRAGGTCRDVRSGNSTCPCGCGGACRAHQRVPRRFPRRLGRHGPESRQPGRSRPG